MTIDGLIRRPDRRRCVLVVRLMTEQSLQRLDRGRGQPVAGCEFLEPVFHVKRPRRVFHVKRRTQSGATTRCRSGSVP
jgi:hypothetical protein